MDDKTNDSLNGAEGKMSQEDFVLLFKDKMSEFEVDAERNSALKLGNSFADLSIQGKNVKDKITKCERECEMLVKRQELFLKNKGFLPRNVRNIGVNVNMTERRNASKSSTQPQLKAIPVKQQQKTGSVHVIDLTEDEKTPKSSTGKDAKTISVKKEETSSSSTLQNLLIGENQRNATFVNVPMLNFANLPPNFKFGQTNTMLSPGNVDPNAVTFVMTNSGLVAKNNIVLPQKVVSSSPATLPTNVTTVASLPNQNSVKSTSSVTVNSKVSSETPNSVTKVPPKPSLTVAKQGNAVQLTWSLKLNANHLPISKYELHGREESLSNASASSRWKKVGDIKALPLPMSCTLTQFVENRQYNFAIRAMDMKCRFGDFSNVVKVTPTSASK